MKKSERTGLVPRHRDFDRFAPVFDADLGRGSLRRASNMRRSVLRRAAPDLGAESSAQTGQNLCGGALALDARGTASVEIVVMLPVFIVLFLAGFYVYSWAQAKQEARTSARGCAFQYAMNGCQAAEDGVDLCAGATPEKLEDSEENVGVLGAIESVPLVGSAVQMLFGEGARAQATRTNAGFLNDEAHAQHEQVVLVCNTRSRTIMGHVKDSFCDFADYVSDGSVDIPGC